MEKSFGKIEKIHTILSLHLAWKSLNSYKIDKQIFIDTLAANLI